MAIYTLLMYNSYDAVGRLANLRSERMTFMGWDFANHLFNSVLQYVITGAFAILCALLGIYLRQKKNKKETEDIKE